MGEIGSPVPRRADPGGERTGYPNVCHLLRSPGHRSCSNLETVECGALPASSGSGRLHYLPLARARAPVCVRDGAGSTHFFESSERCCTTVSLCCCCAPVGQRSTAAATWRVGGTRQKP